jgi:hypothetical protein
MIAEWKACSSAPQLGLVLGMRLNSLNVAVKLPRCGVAVRLMLRIFVSASEDCKRIAIDGDV